MKAYKFRPNFKCEKYTSLLKGKIWFASPNSFNDPFDCAVHLRPDLESFDNFSKWSSGLIEENAPATEHTQRQIETRIFYDKLSTEEGRDEYFATKETIVNQQIGIFSLAGDFRNILLWSHYANKHKGFCIEYDIDALSSYFLKLHKANRIKVISYPIDYHATLPVLIPSNMGDENIFAKQFSIKYQDWNYEKEFRFFLLDNSNVEKDIPLETISAVIIGWKMDADSVESIKNSLRTFPHNPNLIRAIKRFDSYELHFERIEY